MDIWAECNHAISPESIGDELFRVVESQEQIATNSIVDSLEEQVELEKMLESAKPAPRYPVAGLDYLLATPFRYPPLKHGSRFGTRNEPSLFYGSLSIITALAETGYYRLLFWLGMSEPPKSGEFVTQHTVFSADYAAKKGLKLQNSPFNGYEQYLIHVSNYTVTQLLGQKMRTASIEAFEYRSARDTDNGLNVALFKPTALVSTKPKYKEQWLCETNGNKITFVSSTGSIHKYSTQSFLADGKFPQPAV